MTYLPIKSLPFSGTLTGAETFPVTQSGAVRRTTLAAVKAFIVGLGSLAVATPAAPTAGTAFTVSGTYANTPPAALDYSLDGGITWSAVSSPAISSGAFSFNVIVTAANQAETIRVRDHDAQSVMAISGAFVLAAVPVESAEGATVTTVGSTICDAAGNNYGISSAGYVVTNGNPETTISANVVELAYHAPTTGAARQLYQKNSSSLWYTRPNPQTVYSQTSDPTGIVVVTPPVPVPSGTATGKFYATAQGRMVAPDGTDWIGKGVNVLYHSVTDGGAPNNSGNGTNNGLYLMQMFPKLNVVRLGVRSGVDYPNSTAYDGKGPYNTFITNLTNAKIVVIVENHQGGNPVWYGQQLADESAWYANWANTYKNNPYVWYGTINEPGEGDGVLAQQQATYNAIRNTGNPHPIAMEVNYPATTWRNKGSWFSGMHNIFWDAHFYGGPGQAPDLAKESQVLAGIIADLRGGLGVSSADGVMPILIGEYGTSITGDSKDPDGEQIVTAVQTSDVTLSTAWCWNAGRGDRVQLNGNLTDFGREFLQFLDGNPPLSWVSYDGS